MRVFFVLMMAAAGVPAFAADGEQCDQAAGIIAPEVPCVVANADVDSLDEQIFRLMAELTRSESGRVSAIGDQDYGRIMSYFDRLAVKANEYAHFKGDGKVLIMWPLMDLSQSLVMTENSALNEANKALLQADYSLRVSESARMNDGLLSHDHADFMDLIAKARRQVESFYTGSNPTDYPQSSPRTEIVEPAAATE